MTRICTICARGGSKGVPGKNLAMIAGAPLIAHTIRHARESHLFAAIVVSSDSPEIRAAAARFGADLAVNRPDRLAGDHASKIDAIRHAVVVGEVELGISPRTVVDLDATSPLREPSDIAGAVALLETSGVRSVITGARARRSPYFNLVERRDDGTVAVSKTPSAAVVRRQDAPPSFDMNASIYVWTRDALVDEPAVFYPDTLLYEMPEERSLDIDSPLDFEIVSYLMNRRKTQ